MARRPGGALDSNVEIAKAKLSKENIRESLFVFSYVRPYRVYFISGMVFIALSSLTTLAFPFLLNKLIDSAQKLAQGHGAISPGTVALGMMAVLLVQVVLSFFRVFFFSKVGENALADLRSDVFKKMISMPMEFFSRHQVGELSSRITADLSQIQDTVTSVLAEIIRGLLTFLICIVLLVFISPQLTLMILAVIPFVVLSGVLFSRLIRKMSRDAQDELALSNTVVQESLLGIANVKSFSNENYEILRYKNRLSRAVSLAVESSKYRGLFVAFLIFSLFGTVTLVVWYGTTLMQKGVLTFGSLTAFVLYSAFVGATMAGFADLFAQLQKTMGATQRVREMMREVPEALDTVIKVEPSPARVDRRLTGLVAFEKVKFTYPSRPDVSVLKGVTFTAKPGEQIAIVGRSGAGKSTLASLLLRFYDPNSGTIRFDGTSSTLFQLSELRRQIAWVPQDVLLFGGSILDNINYGKPGAAFGEVEEAAKKANADEFIMSFPEGYSTIVGERGIKLSGGQRQRIAIARALLKDPAILILDEATSSLDSASEHLVQDALQNLRAGRTSFVIAHRLATVREADQILVLDRGIIVEQGTHNELVALQGGLYHELSRLQFDSVPGE